MSQILNPHPSLFTVTLALGAGGPWGCALKIPGPDGNVLLRAILRVPVRLAKEPRLLRFRGLAAEGKAKPGNPCCAIAEELVSTTKVGRPPGSEEPKTVVPKGNKGTFWTI